MKNINKFLYMHIGLPKTGTSYLQFFLCHNSKALSDNGVYYPDLPTGNLYTKTSVGGDRNGNAYPLAYSYLDDSSITNCPINNITLKNLSKVLEKIDSDILLSSEWLNLIRPYVVRAINSLALSYGYKLIVICYVRRQDLWVESEYNQRIKINRQYISFENFNYIPNFFNKLKSYINILDDDAIMIKCFEKSQFYKGDLILDFLQCVGISNLDELKFEKSIVNKSLSYGALNMINEMNKYGIKNSPAIQLLISYLENMPAQEKMSIKPSWYSPEQRVKLLKCVADDNTKLAKRFISKDREELFNDPISPISSHWIDARDQRLKIEEIDRIIHYLESNKNVIGAMEILSFMHNKKQTFV